MKGIPDSLQEVVSVFAELTDTRSRLAKLIEWGNALPGLSGDEKVEEHKVPGCLSVVHIRVDCVDGLLQYQGDSDTILVKGLVALLVKGLSGLSPEEVLNLSPDFIRATGIKQSLVPSRANGFRNIFLRMQELAKEALEAQKE